MITFAIFVVFASISISQSNGRTTGPEAPPEEGITEQKELYENGKLPSSPAVNSASLLDGKPTAFNNSENSVIFIEYGKGYTLTDIKLLGDLGKRLSEEEYGKTKNSIIYLVLDLDNIEEPYDYDKTIETLMKEGKSAGFQKYGTFYEVKTCIQDNEWIKMHKDSKQTWDFIFINVDYSPNMFFCEPEVTFNCIQRAMERCQRKVTQHLPELEVYFELHHEIASKIAVPLKKWANTSNVILLSNINVITQLTGSESTHSTMEWVRGRILTNSMTYWRQIAKIQTPTPKDIAPIVTNQTDGSQRSEESNCLFTKTDATVNSSSINNYSFSNQNFGVILDTGELITSEFAEFDANDLRPFIQLIATKFTKVFLADVKSKYILNNYTESYIPEAVARYNVRNAVSKELNCSDCKPALQVYLEVVPDDEQELLERFIANEPTALESAKEVADSANLLYNGTVPYIFLWFDYAEQEEFLSTLGQLHASARSKYTECKVPCQSSYQVGASLHINHCFKSQYLVLPLVQRIPFVLFRTYISFRRAKHVSLNSLFGELRLCLAKVRRQTPHVGVGFRVQYRIDTNRTAMNSHSWLWLWKDLNSWATDKNVTLFVDSVFEARSKFDMHRGWWNFINDKPCYGSTDEYTFLENILVTNTSVGDKRKKYDSKTENTSIILAGHSITIELLTENDANPKGLHNLFNVLHFGVLLRMNLISNTDDKEYTDDDVNYILKLVRSRFSSIMMTPIDKDTIEFEQSHLYIPFGAAKLNSDLYNNSRRKHEKQLLESTTKPLKISLPFIYNTNDMSQAAYRIARKFAVEANDIFPGTVENLLVDTSKWKLEVLKTHLKQIVNMELENQKDEDTKKLPYKFGMVSRLKWCANETFKSTVEHVLPHVQLVVFTLGASGAYLDAVATTTQNIWKCHQRMRETFPSVDVKYGILFIPDRKSATLTELINFWIKINDFAVKYNVSVFMMEAFDQSNEDVKCGWWRVLGNNLQEKYQVVYKSNIVNSNVNKPHAGPKHNVAIIVSFSVVAVILVALTVAVLFVIYFRKNVVSALLGLSEKEMLEFFEGRKMKNDFNCKSNDEKTSNDGTSTGTDFECFAYDNSLELERHSFTLDEASKLGSGAYGEVCLGHITLDGRQIVVAVKTVKSVGENAEGLTSLRSLLMEVKILSYIGKHYNIVALLGAHTGKLREGEAYAFLELCSLGSLQKFLKKLRCLEKNNLEDVYTSLVDSDYETNPLGKWSLDIATGMEFLASKQIVHADLATRNVLLDKYNKAKICDFGLSRRMLNYQSYQKTHQEPLPWKWMSPESLRGNIFNEKTDVWSFGVTLWEMYTLGENPYAGLSWNIEFASKLENGLRLPPPKQLEAQLSGFKSMYPIMELCWTTDPKQRPHFKQLKDMLVV